MKESKIQITQRKIRNAVRRHKDREAAAVWKKLTASEPRSIEHYFSEFNAAVKLSYKTQRQHRENNLLKTATGLTATTISTDEVQDGKK